LAVLADAPAGGERGVRLIVRSAQRLGLYGWGLLLWLGFVAFILTGLFTAVKEAPYVHVQSGV
jgi:hypothetical protein